MKFRPSCPKVAANAGDKTSLEDDYILRIQFTVTLHYWRVAAALDVREQFAPPRVRDSLVLIVDVVLHLTLCTL